MLASFDARIAVLDLQIISSGLEDGDARDNLVKLGESLATFFRKDYDEWEPMVRDMDFALETPSRYFSVVGNPDVVGASLGYVSDTLKMARDREYFDSHVPALIDMFSEWGRRLDGRRVLSSHGGFGRRAVA